MHPLDPIYQGFELKFDEHVVAEPVTRERMGHWSPWQFKLSWVQAPVMYPQFNLGTIIDGNVAGVNSTGAARSNASRPFSISLCGKDGQTRLPPEDINPGNPGLWLTDVFIT
jgi:hypothetical protein